MQELLGSIVNKMSVNEDQSVLKFETDQGDKLFVAYGDCCSETWFADILIQNNFTGFRVIEVVDLELPNFVQKLIESDGRSRQEYDTVYGYRVKLKDDRSWQWSEIEIIFRNSSNGYYGGSVDFKESLPSWVESNNWIEITKDWQA